MAYWTSNKALSVSNLNEFGDEASKQAIVNQSSNSTDKTYSCNYENNLNTYSTTEKFTGKYWIDGKKIYRKVLTADSLTYSNQIATIPTNITNIDNLINFKGTLYDSDHGWYSLPYVTHLNYQWAVGYELDNKNYSTPTILIRNYAYSDARFSKYIFILEYTKTTD